MWKSNSLSQALLRAKVTLVLLGLRSVFLVGIVGLGCLASSGIYAGCAHSGHVARVTKRKPDAKGGVLVVMYHNFGPGESRYVRSYKDFRGDLENFYALGFRPVTMSQYLSNSMPLPPGASPVVITMDDSAPTQFQVNQKGSIRSPLCGRELAGLRAEASRFPGSRHVLRAAAGDVGSARLASLQGSPAKEVGQRVGLPYVEPSAAAISQR